MAINKQLEEVVLVFEIENKQDSYARCLSAINYFENNILNAGISANTFYSYVKKIPKKEFTFRVNKRNKGPHGKMEYPITTGEYEYEYARVPIPAHEEEKLLESAVNNWRKEQERLERPLYHIRVKFEDDFHLDNLQFLAMFMQQVYFTCFNTGGNFIPDEFVPEKLKKRLSIFLLPHSRASWEFAYKNFEDTDTDAVLYSQASQYLRLIAKMHNGVIFGCSPSGKAEAVEFKTRSRNNTFFPLIYLADTNSNGNYHAIFDRAGMPDVSVIEKGFTYQIKENDPRPFNKAGSSNPHEAVADLILDETRARLLNFFAPIYESGQNEEITQDNILERGRENISEFIKKITDYTTMCDRFTFALFGYLLFSNEKDNNKAIAKAMEETMRLARELGDGIRQVVQNSIQHSQHHTCFISLNQVDGLLYVRVTDLNEQRTITQTFIEILQKEKKHGIFLRNNTNITIKHLISEFTPESDDDALTAWYAYRKADSAAHIGLTMFNNTLKRCQCGEFQIISNTMSTLQQNNVYIRSQSNNSSLPNRVIPGTQISFSIPIATLVNSSPVNLVQLANNDAFSENHIALAHYLDYRISKDKWKGQKPDLDNVSNPLYHFQIPNTESKVEAQDKWKFFWIGLMNSPSGAQNKIHLCDINDTLPLKEFLNNRDHCEVFIKGFLAAASVYSVEPEPEDAEYCPLCFYFLNLPDHFIDIFQEVSIPLSLMDFSKKLQIYFSCAEKHNTTDDTYQPKRLLLLGNCVGHAIQNAYIMSLEYGERGIDKNYYDYASVMLSPYQGKLEHPVTLPVCPFTVFEQQNDFNELPEYFIRFAEIASRDLACANKDKRGYKFPDIHMRLGNKVHARSFFEMSFLFYRTTVVNRVAFYILQKIIEDICDVEDDIVFYGYASYSQALIVSLQEMLQKYFENDIKKNGKEHSKYSDKNVYYAIYQYNLQTESYLAQSARYSNGDLSYILTRDKMQIYSTLQKREGNKINTSVVQIVPIGSTLTTFDKMRAKYLKDRKNIENSKIVKNYNVFLIRDANEKYGEVPSNIERDLWASVKTDDRIVTVDGEKLQYLKDAPDISYIIAEESHWWRPTECDYCFPDDISKEVPIVETDPTSTVPSLQIYPVDPDPVLPDILTENNLTISLAHTNKIIRLSELIDCVYYGHFLRGKNHYQYYFDTQKYISKDIIKKQLVDWLKEERKKDNETPVNIAPFLNIIFSPEHNTNVGFSQYVNAFYFNSTAEIVSVNVDKQFRSNFICEHDALKQTIERLHSERLDKALPVPVRFFFADDSIITGESYHRARSLLLSLIPEQYRSEYHGYLFSKCFILIDRLSSSTRESYIADPWKNYLSFCKISISNMRKQGDSCVGCKLENEAGHLLKRSSTRSFYSYWARKSRDYYPNMFDDSQKINKYGGLKAYVRMLLTHVTGNYIKKYRIKHNKIDRIAIEDLFNFIMNESMKPIEYEKNIKTIIVDDEETALVKKAFQALSQEKDQTERDIIVCLLEHMVKILARPFFSYNLEVKQHVLGLIIDLCESLLSDSIQPQEGLVENIKQVLESTDKNQLKLLNFLRDCLFEALADMKSTYILRKCSIEKAYRFIAKYVRLETSCSVCDIKNNCKCFSFFRRTSTVSDFSCGVSQARYFWKKYAFNIHKIIDSGEDETRSLWMEHLFSFGTEYPKKTGGEETVVKGVSLPLYEAIITKVNQDEKAKSLFEEFCMEIFFQNSRLLYDGIEKSIEKTPGIDPSDNSYFLQNMMKMREWNLERAEVESISKNITKEEKFMFKFLTSYIENDKNTKRKYKMLVKSIFKMVEAKYGIPSKSLCAALLTQRDENKAIDINTFEIIAIDVYGNSSDNHERALERTIAKYEIKKRIKSAITNNKDTRLIDDGYYLEMSENVFLSDDENDLSDFRKPYFILRFDNIQTTPRSQSIEKVYIYVSFNAQLFENQGGKVIPILVMRDILSYRTHIMHALEKDFNSQLMQKYARTLEENTILANEKTVSHTIGSDDQIPVFLWEADKQPEQRHDYEWLLFRNYTNIQIAKLFNRLLLENKDESTQAPKLYLKDGDEKTEGKFTLPAKNFLDDIFNDEDRRVKLCKEIIEFETNISGCARLVTPKNAKGYFNKEYLKCILFDIFLTSAKYWNENVDFLKRINHLKSCKDKYTEYKKQQTVDSGYSIDMATNERNICRILLLRDVNKLVIINPVDQIDNHVFGGNKKLNQFIKIQLENPYDSFAGRMSLFTISKYITGNGCEAPLFEYKSFNELKPEWKKCFSEKWEKMPEDASTWFISELTIFYQEE